MTRKFSLFLLLLALLCGTANSQDSLNVTRVGQLSLDASGVAVSGSYAYVAGDSGLCIVDISNPATPIALGFYSTLGLGWANDVAVSGSYAFIVTWGAGLRIVDVSNPANPFEVGYCYLPDVHAMDVVISGSYAFVADYSAGLRIIDVSNPAAPFEAGFVDSWGASYGVAVSGSYAYMANANVFSIVDISNPASPFEVGFYDYTASGSVFSVVISDSYAYLADGYFGLRIVDVTNPAAPFESGFYDPPPWWFAVDVAVSGFYAYMADGGLRILNVSNPANPVETGFYHMPGDARGVVVYGPYVYVAEQTNFGIYDCSQAQPVKPFSEIQAPSAFSLSPPYPNPFNPTTIIRFDLPYAARVTLEVFDIGGCRVGVGLAPTRLYLAGSHEIIFDGSNLSSGIYLYRLSAGANIANGKLVLLK